MRYEKFIFALCSLLFALCSCNKVVEEPEFIPEPQQTLALGSNGIISCWTGLMVEVSGDTIDLTKFGFYHNELMKGGFPIYSTSVDSFQFLSDITDTINSRILASSFSDLQDYVPPISLSSSELYSIAPSYFWITDTKEYANTLVSDIERSLSGIESKGYLNEDERLLILDLVNAISTGLTIDPCEFRSDWANISNRAENGVFSGSALALGIYSYMYWSDILEEEEVQAIVIADFFGYVVGYFYYMATNWVENHTDPEFGLNMLKAGIQPAISSSATAGWWR